MIRSVSGPAMSPAGDAATSKLEEQALQVTRGFVKERTTAQIYAVPGTLYDTELRYLNQRHYETYRRMRHDPTIAFARMLTVAPMMLAGWTYEAKKGAPTDAKEFHERRSPHDCGQFKNAIEWRRLRLGWVRGRAAGRRRL